MLSSKSLLFSFNRIVTTVLSASRLTPYRGRFAPSPTGELHLGSLACAMASFLDARAHDGTWLVRIEDVDKERCSQAYARSILETLGAFGLASDEPVIWQSNRDEVYEKAFTMLKEENLIYGCACTRKEIKENESRLGLPEGVYPGTCRGGTHGKPIRSWRFRVKGGPVSFVDRLCGPVTQDVLQSVGDFVVRRADGLWAYQLAVVLDDAAQKITDVVRGQDLLDNTPRQILLQQAMSIPTPRYMHIALVCDKEGRKLSKQNRAEPVKTDNPVFLLDALLGHFGLAKTGEKTLTAFWKNAVKVWKETMPE